MQLTVKGKHLDVGDSLREHVKEQLTHTAQKYFHDPIEATVVFSKEKNRLFKADIFIHVGGGIVLQAAYEADDPYPAFDMAAKLVAKRLSRYKDKLRDHHKYEPIDLDAAYTTFKGDGGAAEGVAGVQRQGVVEDVEDFHGNALTTETLRHRDLLGEGPHDGHCAICVYRTGL